MDIAVIEIKDVFLEGRLFAASQPLRERKLCFFFSLAQFAKDPGAVSAWA